MSRLTALIALAGLAVLLGTAPVQANKILIPVQSVTANVPNGINTPDVLISNALGNYNYVQPNPGSGGGGTSWYTFSDGSTPVQLTFNFPSASTITELAIWDYYGHTPQQWNLSLYSGAGATGTQLQSMDFSIGSGNYTPARWYTDVPDTAGVLSALLTTRNNSQWGGVGLSEVGFAPEPSSFVLLGLAVVALLGYGVRRKRAA
jgi:hypothetical protein